MKVFIYKINGNEIHDKELNKYYSKIDIIKRKQINNYVNDFDKSKCFIAHLIVYLYYKGNVSYEYNYNNKMLNVNSKDYFNISYSGDYVVIVFNEHEVGIDIEKINQISKSELEHYASFSERKIFTNKLEYTKLWCLKESYLKYLGCGITKNLKDIEFEKNGQKYICKNDRELYIDVFQIENCYICAVITDSTKQTDIEFIDMKNIKLLI